MPDECVELLHYEEGWFVCQLVAEHDGPHVDRITGQRDRTDVQATVTWPRAVDVVRGDVVEVPRRLCDPLPPGQPEPERARTFGEVLDAVHAGRFAPGGDLA